MIFKCDIGKVDIMRSLVISFSWLHFLQYLKYSLFKSAPHRIVEMINCGSNLQKQIDTHIVEMKIDISFKNTTDHGRLKQHSSLIEFTQQPSEFRIIEWHVSKCQVLSQVSVNEIKCSLGMGMSIQIELQQECIFLKILYNKNITVKVHPSRRGSYLFVFIIFLELNEIQVTIQYKVLEIKLRYN